MRKNRQERRAEKARKIIDPIKIYMNAERFRITDVHLRQTENMSAIGAAMGGPTLVLSAFASELYFKCLIAIETERIVTGHELRTLFLMLPRPTQVEIEKSWDDYVALPQRQRLYEVIESHESTVIPRDLRWSLKQGNDAFTSLRYIHENENGPKFFLGDLPSLLRDVILVRRPDWRQLVHSPMKEMESAPYEIAKEE